MFTAQWSKQAYTVTFEAGTDGTMTGDAAAQVDYNGSVPADKIPTVTAGAGKVFIGWLNSGDNSVYTAASLANYKVTGNVTFTAQYANDSDAIVIFDYDGGTATAKRFIGRVNLYWPRQMRCWSRLGAIAYCAASFTWICPSLLRRYWSSPICLIFIASTLASKSSSVAQTSAGICCAMVLIAYCGWGNWTTGTISPVS